MYYSDEYENLDKFDKKLRQYTKDEIPIYDNEVFDTLLSRYPLKEDSKVYRGINFKTKLDYLKFIKKIKKDGGYISSTASSFSTCKTTAEGFAHSPKSYYLDKDVMLANKKRNEEAERLSGYCGVLISFDAKAGQVVDVNASDLGIESEILTKPSELIPCSIDFIPNYKELIKTQNIDINKYVQNCERLNDGLFNFIVMNHSTRLNNDSANHILNKCLESTEEENSNKIEKIKQHRDLELIHVSRYFSVVKKEEDKGYYRNYEKYDSYHFRCPNNIQYYESLGCFRPEQYKKIQNVADEILNQFFAVHCDLGQKEHIHDLSAVSWFAKFSSENIQKLYKNNILKRNNKILQDLTNSSSDINKLPPAERKNAIGNMSEDIVNILNKIISEKMPSKNRQTKRLSGNKK